MNRVLNIYLIKVRNLLNSKSSRNTLEEDVLQRVKDMLINPSRYIQKCKGNNTFEIYTMTKHRSLREFNPEQGFVASIRVTVKRPMNEEVQVQFSWSSKGQCLTMCI